MSSPASIKKSLIMLICELYQFIQWSHKIFFRREVSREVQFWKVRQYKWCRLQLVLIVKVCTNIHVYKYSLQRVYNIPPCSYQKLFSTHQQIQITHMLSPPITVRYYFFPLDKSCSSVRAGDCWFIKGIMKSRPSPTLEKEER